MLSQAFAGMIQADRNDKMTGKHIHDKRICQFSLRDLVRVDFVFPYGRVAASKTDLVPEPFDRDATFAVSPKEIEEMKTSVISLFSSK